MASSCTPLTLVVLCGWLLTACAWGANPPPTLTRALEAQRANLSDPQQIAVTAAAREMTGDPSAPVHSMTSRTSPGEPGIHVCGYVKTPGNDSTPLYVELREADGTVTAERGQIGASPATLAKVRFMCRQHGEW
jgi:hypothetical protein